MFADSTVITVNACAEGGEERWLEIEESEEEVADRDFENFKERMQEMGVAVAETDQHKVTFTFTDGRVFEVEAQCDRFGEETALVFDLIS